MDGLALTVATTTTTTTSSATTSSSFSSFTCRIPVCSFLFSTNRRNLKTLNFPSKPIKFSIFASRDEPPNLDPMDQMELKFGRLIGEDPKLTLAKIMGRKANPDATFIEIEKAFYKNKGKIVELKEIPIDGSKEEQSSSSLDGLNLVRPVPKKGFKSKANDNKPVVSDTRKPSQSQSLKKPVDGMRKPGVPNVILRKPTMVNEDDVEDKPSRLRIKRNLSLPLKNVQAKEKFSDMTLLRKPEPMVVNESGENKEEHSGDAEAKVVGDMKLEMVREEVGDNGSDFTLLEKPETRAIFEGTSEQFGNAESVESDVVDDFENMGLKGSTDVSQAADAIKSVDDSLIKRPTRLQPQESVGGFSSGEEMEKELSDSSSVISNAKPSAEAALRGKPKRLDQSMKVASARPEKFENSVEFENLFVTSSLEGHEDADWTRAEDLVKTGDRGEVELISCSNRGFVVSFGSLIGFLPYRNLAARWKFLAFESWLRRKGLDPSLYRQNLGIIGNYDAANKNSFLDSSQYSTIDLKTEEQILSDMKVDDLLRIYDQEKIKFLSSFIGQKLKVNVVLANRKLRKLIFSLRPKEKEELVEKKKSLMAKLQVGDVVKCCIKKITYFGIFVEIDGVPALIHQTEVSWDATLDPLSYFKIGQIVEAKVHQLDFTLGRIFLSLKEIMPDPLIEALESVVGDHGPLDGRLRAAEADSEWDDVESLIKELQQTEGIQSVSKGRFFLSPGLAPTFQVYMASMFENQYKLLARSGNKVQEVIVQTSMGKEEMKSAILTCTNRVE
ncbi:uncharacterized protein LOC107429903 isoform X1 [Ziziphus jujuba]|uniref:Uncharacterized protein LOC107429903 isoform X1 n=2 Tax=Ziziphus jujuba TaxID=326968 RepID=A0A6P4ALW9_ZIZJJ|nr:uncharacterized protein LOC107429903 isoform X1 [Ziziphus jujuba]